ncbi:hypothetical protein DCAR_0414969 [Daucus carota subsp. sativus]|uniref:Uncharacterized protein n=1 Tax=Daucus carota subsp. sativus TaxID=79200 RepID=A0A165A4G5_DAUCS|nr:hypothetical protein DCAR_0414969 [Daucus carota subsp. sativus]
MHAVNDEMTQILEENIRSMEREIPKLMAEVANTKKMEWAACSCCWIANDRLFIPLLMFESFLWGLYMLLVYASDVGYTANSAGRPLPHPKNPTQCNNVY